MATTRMRLADISKRAPDVDRRKIAATTEADIRRHMVEDGEDPDAPLPAFAPSPRAVRDALGLTQDGIAELTGIPVRTWRNWEQQRVKTDPAIRALLVILAREPAAAKRALRKARKGT